MIEGITPFGNPAISSGLSVDGWGNLVLFLLLASEGCRKHFVVS